MDDRISIRKTKTSLRGGIKPLSQKSQFLILAVASAGMTTWHLRSGLSRSDRDMIVATDKLRNGPKIVVRACEALDALTSRDGASALGASSRAPSRS
jgi:hypothetical protein